MKKLLEPPFKNPCGGGHKNSFIKIKSKKIDYKKVAILILTHSDYKSYEIALAAITKFTNRDVDIYIMQNGLNVPNCYNCLAITKKYMELFKNIHLIHADNQGENPWLFITNFIKSEIIDKYDYIIKMDDDSFPLKNDWIENLISPLDDDIILSTPLCSSSTEVSAWYSLQIIDQLDNFYKNAWTPHFSGRDMQAKNSDILYDMLKCCNNKFPECGKKWIDKPIWDFTWEGTSCGPAHFIRFIHEEISLKPKKFLDCSESLNYSTVLIPPQNYITINCICMTATTWKNAIEYFSIMDGWIYDEININHYLLKDNKCWALCLNTPAVHIHRSKHRIENCDLNDKFYSIYSNYLGLKWNIKMNLSDKKVQNNHYEDPNNRYRYWTKKLILKFIHRK